MRPVILAEGILALFLALIPAAGAGPELWHETAVKGTFYKNAGFSCAGGLRSVPAVGLYQVYIDAGVQYRIVSWLRTGLHYRFIREKKVDAFLTENRPYGQGELVLRTAKGILTNRHRLETRLRAGKEAALRYRTRLQYRLPTALPEYLSCLYGGCEVFTTDDKWRVGRTWLTVGWQPKWGKTGLNLFLRHQADYPETGGSERNMIIGFNCSVSP